MGFLDKYRPVLAIDAGTQSLRVSKDGEMIFNEATAIAIHPEKHKVDQIGNAAIESTGLRLYRPFDYVIQDFQAFELLLNGAIKKNEQKWLPPSYKIFFSISSTASEVDKRAYRDCGEHANAVEVYMAYSSAIAAINMGLIRKKKNFVIIELSASKLEFTAFSNDLYIVLEGLKTGTKKLEQLIHNYLRRKHQLIAKEEELRQLIHSYGKGALNIKIQHKEIAFSEIESIIENYLWLAEDTIRNGVENLPEQSRSRILENGFYFTGGGSLYQSLCQTIANRCGLKANFSEQPLLDPIKGLNTVTQNFEAYKDYLMA